jgi:glyoxylase-like metal-dependent hydrolase (beta-lactamase superfamily II)
VLFVADAAANMHGIRGPFLYEDEQLARESVRKLAELRVDNAVFGHGRPIMGNAGEALDRLAREFGGV